MLRRCARRGAPAYHRAAVGKAAGLLGLPRDSKLDPASLKSAYLRRALDCHPDRNPSARATEEFQALTDALNTCLSASATAATRSAATKASSGSGAGASREAVAAGLHRLREQCGEIIDAQRTAHVGISEGSIGGEDPGEKGASMDPLTVVAACCRVGAEATRAMKVFATKAPPSLCRLPSFDVFFATGNDPRLSARMGAFVNEVTVVLPFVVTKLRPEAVAGLKKANVAHVPLSPLVLVGSLVIMPPRTEAEREAGLRWPAEIEALQCCDALRCRLELPEDLLGGRRRVRGVPPSKFSTNARRRQLTDALVKQLRPWQACRCAW